LLVPYDYPYDLTFATAEERFARKLKDAPREHWGPCITFCDTLVI
jgi:hypothetical protein